MELQQTVLRRRRGNFRPCGRAPSERRPGTCGCRTTRSCIGHIASACHRSCRMRGTNSRRAPPSKLEAVWSSVRRWPARAVPPRRRCAWALPRLGGSRRWSGPAVRRRPGTCGCETTRSGDRSAAACSHSCRRLGTRSRSRLDRRCLGRRQNCNAMSYNPLCGLNGFAPVAFVLKHTNCFTIFFFFLLIEEATPTQVATMLPHCAMLSRATNQL